MSACRFPVNHICYWLIPLILLSGPVFAELDWLAVTFDNDVFINSDNGYSNGLFVSIFDISDSEELREPDALVRPLMWSALDTEPLGTINSYTFGQTMVTPTDIEIVDPRPGEVPYAGLLALNNTYIRLYESYADKFSTTVGIVGPLSGAKSTQKFIHKLTDSPDPKGWDTQLKNEPVFQFSRARVWRYWVSSDDKVDVLLNAEVAVGNLSSSVSTGVTLRYGSNLARSYVTNLYDSSRSTNIAAIDGGWNLYAGLKPGYVANQIFTDGNTFRNSRSIDYDHGRVGLIAGFSYSFQNLSISLAFNDLNLIESDKQLLREFDRFGSITLAFKL